MQKSLRKNTVDSKVDLMNILMNRFFAKGYLNSKIELLHLLIRKTLKKEDRQLFLKWIEMKEDIINEYDFNLWVTKNVLDNSQEDLMEEVDL